MASSVIDLKNAVRNGDKDLVVKLLDQGVDPNQFGSHANNATSPLMVACVNGHLDLINLLIDRGAKVNLQNGRLETALSKVTSIDMTQSVMLEVVGVLLQNNAKVRFGYDYQKSAMMIACEKGNVELVRLMLPYDGWDEPDYTNTIFDVVNTYGDTKVMELLLTSKHITMDREKLANLVHKACLRTDDPEIVSIMLDRNPELVDCTCEFYSDGYTPLMRASVRRRTKIVKMLLERGANIDYQCQLDSPHGVAGFSALMVAVKSVQRETVELLLEEGAAVDLTDKTGRTALIIACQNGQTELSRMLIAKRANVDHVDCRGRYPLLYAVEFAVEENCYSSKTISPYADNNYYQLIELLLERGAKADFVSSNKETAQKLLQANAPTFLPLVNSANLKCPRLMAILEMDLGTTVEDKDQESEKMSRKRDRSSSIELSEERAPKTFRSNPPSSVSHFPEEDYRESPSAAPVAISQQSTIGGTQVPIQLAAATFTQEPDPYAVKVANIDDSTVLGTPDSADVHETSPASNESPAVMPGSNPPSSVSEEDCREILSAAPVAIPQQLTIATTEARNASSSNNRSNPPTSVSHFPEEDYRESPSAAPVAISQQLTIGVAAGPEYVPNRVQPDGGKIMKYPVFDRSTRPAKLKLHDANDRTTDIVPQHFYKTPSQRQYYDMRALKHGIALIINNRFKDSMLHLEREGTERDEYNLVQTFYYLGYRPVVCNDLNSAEICYIFDNLDSFLADSGSEETANDSFVCCILSHGTKDSIIGSDSKPISRDYIEQQTGKSSMLSGKPKIFFVQACRGRDLGSEPIPTRRIQADGDSDRADLYVCCAAVSGDKSYRNTRLGTWFITELCKILCEFGTRYNLNEIQKDLNAKVPKNLAYRFENSKDGKWYVQQPSCSNDTLQHDVHFFHK